jgi:predicted histidine transporter YuiF (NhaC family)
MEAAIELILSYVSIWMPSLTAIIGIVTSILIALSKVREATEELKKDETIKNLANEVNALLRENKAIREQYDIIIDELKKVKNYRENKK